MHRCEELSAAAHTAAGEARQLRTQPGANRRDAVDGK